MAICALCDEPVDPENRLTLREVSGWEQQRDQGGLHGLTLREPTGRFAHWNCVDRFKKGLAVGQTSLV